MKGIELEDICVSRSGFGTERVGTIPQPWLGLHSCTGESKSGSWTPPACAGAYGARAQFHKFHGERKCACSARPRTHQERNEKVARFMACLAYCAGDFTARDGSTKDSVLFLIAERPKERGLPTTYFYCGSTAAILSRTLVRPPGRRYLSTEVAELATQPFLLAVVRLPPSRFPLNSLHLLISRPSWRRWISDFDAGSPPCAWQASLSVLRFLLLSRTTW